MKRLIAVLLLVVPRFAFADGQPSPDPITVAKGQPSPGDGVFLFPDTAALIVQKCQEDKTARAELQKALEAQPPPTATSTIVVLSAVSLALGVALGAVAVKSLTK